MFKLFGCLFFFIAALVIGGLLMIVSFVARLFGFGGFNVQRNSYQSTKNEEKTTLTDETADKQHKKIFDKNEGEYVEFEEVD